MQRSSRISMVTLITCLFISSLVILPAINVAGLFVLEISGVESEKNNLFVQADFDEEFLIDTNVGATLARIIFSKSRPMSLYYQTAYLSPVSPPPKQS